MIEKKDYIPFKELNKDDIVVGTLVKLKLVNFKSNEGHGENTKEMIYNVNSEVFNRYLESDRMVRLRKTNSIYISNNNCMNGIKKAHKMVHVDAEHIELNAQHIEFKEGYIYCTVLQPDRFKLYTDPIVDIWMLCTLDDNTIVDIFDVKFILKNVEDL